VILNLCPSPRTIVPAEVVPSARSINAVKLVEKNSPHVGAMRTCGECDARRVNVN
jgi:hypothetical protein